MNDVAIIIPVYNDKQGIEVTSASLIKEIEDNDFDSHIYIIDNGSNDGMTRKFLRHLTSKTRGISVMTEKEVQSSYAARNKGIQNTSSAMLAFVDADMTVPEGWLKHAIHEMVSHDADYMGCNVELTLPNNPSLAARYDAHTGFPVEQYIKCQHFAPTCCLFVRRKVFEDVGLFDHRLTSGGDKEFGNRVYEAGYDLHFAENVTMYHPVRESIRDLVMKDLRVGRGHCQLQRYYPDRYGKPGIPPRPSGLKSPDNNLPLNKKLVFGGLSGLLTCVRGAGYYWEYSER